MLNLHDDSEKELVHKSVKRKETAGIGEPENMA